MNILESHSNVMAGAAIVSACFSQEHDTEQAIQRALDPLYDTQLKSYLHFIWTGQHPIDADLESPLANKRLQTMREELTRKQTRDLEGKHRAIQQSLATRAAETMRAMNAPSPMCTVAELATKFNKSKSEIRRLKVANLLHTLIEG